MFDPTPESEILHRLACLKKALARGGRSSILITHKPDLYYFSGTAQDAYLWVSLDHDPLLLVKRYLPRARRESCIKDILSLGSVRDMPGLIMDHCGQLPKTMDLALDVVPVRDFRFYGTLFPGVDMGDGAPAIQACRSIKSTWEIKQLERSARVSKQTFDFMADHLAPGVSESDFCGQVEAFARTCGHSGQIQTRHYRSEGFLAHLLSGDSGGLPGALDSPLCGTGPCIAYPYGAGPRIIRDNESLLMDLGSMCHGYHMDETRMFLLGNVDDAVVDAGEKSLEILHYIQEIMAPGVAIGEVFGASVKKAGELGLADSYLGTPGAKSRFVGHGIGLELVEPPIIAPGRKEPLAPGMVFAVEPKCIFPGKYAAGVESVIQITKTGSRFLSVTENKMFRL